MLLLNKSKEREKKKRKSVQLTGNSDNQFSGQLRQTPNGATTGAEVTGEANDRVNRVQNVITETKPNDEPNSKADNQSTDGNSSSSSDLAGPDKEKDAGSSSQGTDSAVHSESEADSLQELAEAIYRRKSKLDRLERECYSFMSRLANRNRTADEERPAGLAEERSNEQYDDSSLILGSYSSRATLVCQRKLCGLAAMPVSILMTILMVIDLV